MTGDPAVLASVRAALDRHVVARARVVVAVSGGPDSAALAVLTVRARPDLEVLLAHVRHGLRDDRADAAAAAALADVLGTGFHESAPEVQARGEGLQAAARAARYEALARIARDAGAATLVLGHTADDQAETVLLNIARGAGLRGLSGMAERTERAAAWGPVVLVRPLLGVRRADARRHATGLPWVEDPSNRDPRHRRVRARQEVLPALSRLTGAETDPVDSLRRLADLARADADLLDELAADQARVLVSRWGPVLAVRADRLSALPDALATRLVRGLLADVRGGLEGVDAATVERVRGLAAGEQLSVAGAATAGAGGGWLAVAPRRLPDLGEHPLPVPGQARLPALGMALRAAAPAAPSALAAARGDTSAPPAGGPLPRPRSVLVADPGPFLVRSRRPGDRISLPAGGRKLQDVFTDAGVPRLARDLVPVVLAADGTVVWAAGVAVRHDPGRAPAVRLSLEPCPQAGPPRPR